MMSFIKKLQTASRARTTYRVGLLQAKAYRILKQNTHDVLKEFNISTIEWAFLGLLHDSPLGMRSSSLADELGVEAPFITQMMKSLKVTKFLDQHEDPNDSRARIIKLTKPGREFVDRTEIHLRNSMRPLVKGVSPQDLVSYLSVMESIIENAK